MEVLTVIAVILMVIFFCVAVISYKYLFSKKMAAIFALLFVGMMVILIVTTSSSSSTTYTPSGSSSSSSSSSTRFTNKYGTPTTKCAHTGCTNYIASSGDTNCCTKHSNRCKNCYCYIDEDAIYCMDCLRKALE